MKSEFERAITQLSADRNLAPEVILEAIEQSLVLAYKKHFGATQSVVVKIDPHTGAAQVYVMKQVVDQVLDPMLEIELPAARALQPTAKVGDLVEVEEHPENFGRIAAQTAKQVITQRIKEAERDTVYAEFEGRVGEIINGVVRMKDRKIPGLDEEALKRDAQRVYDRFLTLYGKYEAHGRTLEELCPPSMPVYKRKETKK